MPALRKIGTQAERLIIALERLRKAPELRKDNSAIVPPIGIGRRERKSTIIIGERIGEPLQMQKAIGAPADQFR